MFGGKRFISYAIKIIRNSLPMKRAKTATQHLLILPDIPIARHSSRLGMQAFLRLHVLSRSAYTLSSYASFLGISRGWEIRR